MAEYFEASDPAGEKKKIVALLDRAQLVRLFKGTYRINSAHCTLHCAAVRFFLDPAPSNLRPMMRIDFGVGKYQDVRVSVGGKSGYILWLEGMLPDGSAVYVFARPPGMVDGDPQRACARIWIAIYSPGTATPRPVDYHFTSKLPGAVDSVLDCPSMPVSELDGSVTNPKALSLALQDDEAEGYHED